MTLWPLALTAFVASAVEAIEAVTIVLAVGYAQSWRIAFAGAAYGFLALVGIVGVGGPAILLFVPLRIVRIAIGAFLLWFGYGWLRKATLRYAGRIPFHDETAIFEREVASLHAKRERRAGLAAAFNGVFLEGLEVAIIVLTVGSASREAFAVSLYGALAAVVTVAVAGVLIRKPFARVPENAMKFAVGVMLVAFGTFWLGEGLGVAWWYGDAAILVLAPGYAAAALLVSLFLRLQ
jgi:Ca2+/H+ antiporter, TMEM165/GDT1 family